MLMRNRRVGGDDLELHERDYYPTRKLLVHETRVPFRSLIIDENEMLDLVTFFLLNFITVQLISNYKILNNNKLSLYLIDF